MALKFKSVFALLHMKIISGQWPEGYKIPTEMELCEHFEVSRVTIRRALDGLVAQGYLTRTRGRGSYVEFRRSLLGSVRGLALDEEPYGTYTIVERGRLAATAVDMDEFGLPHDQGSQMLYHVRSLHTVDSSPTVLSDYYVSPLYGSFIDDLEERCETPFIDVVAKATGQRCHFTTGKLAAIVASGEAQELLGLTNGSASLWCRGYCCLDDGTVIARCSKIFNSLFYEFAIEGGSELRLV